MQDISSKSQIRIKTQNENEGSWNQRAVPKKAIQTTMDRLMDGADQRESLHRVKNHLMNIYGGRFWFSLNFSIYDIIVEDKT